MAEDNMTKDEKKDSTQTFEELWEEISSRFIREHRVVIRNVPASQADLPGISECVIPDGP